MAWNLVADKRHAMTYAFPARRADDDRVTADMEELLISARSYATLVFTYPIRLPATGAEDKLHDEGTE
jgi:hypothetical protein